MSPEEIKFWRDRADAANERGYFDQADYNDAGQWETCAVGEKVKLFPAVVILQRGWSQPRDRVLYRLGIAFNDAVTANHTAYMTGSTSSGSYILDAYEILDLIEARVLVLAARASARAWRAA